MRSLLVAMMLTGCGSVVDVSVSLPDGDVLDPTLTGATGLAVELEGAAGCDVAWRATGLHGRVETMDGPLLTGIADDGIPLDPGPVTVSADADCDEGSGTAVTTAWVVRLGVVEVDFVGESNVPVAFHKLDLARAGLTMVDVPEYQNGQDGPLDLTDLSANDGSPRPSLGVWADPNSPPWGAGEPGTSHNVPAAYVAGGEVELTARLGERVLTATGQVAPAHPETAPAIRLVLDGYGEADGSFVAQQKLPDTVGRHPITLNWRVESQRADASWLPIPGSIQTEHLIYLLRDQPFLADGTDLGFAPAVPWIGVLEDLSDAVTGLPADDAAILDAIRDHLHYDEHIAYNPTDAAYNDYSGPYVYWDYQTSHMTGWLDRSDGIDLWCHSLACLLSVMGETMGVDSRYLVIGEYFDTNTARPAGSDRWQNYSFRAHGIVTPDGERVWDSAVDFRDGDDVLSPKGLQLDTYLSLLTNDSIRVRNEGYCYVH